MLSSLRKCLTPPKINNIKRRIRFLTPPKQRVVLLVLSVFVVTKICTVKIQEPALEYEEYTYESLLSNFYNGSVLNPHPFKYIYTPLNVSTHDNMNLEILILVKSDAAHFSYRMGIRSTWGNFSLDTYKIVFLLGFSSQIQYLINVEYKKFNDIVQEDFIDTYRNNTIKTTMAFNWAVRTYPNAKFVLFVDDDYFVNFNAVTRFLRERRSLKYLIAGFLMPKSRVMRNIESKWHLTKSEYPFMYYPPYVSGGAMLFSMTAVMSVQNAFRYVKTIPIDDVYIGIVAYLYNLKFTHDDRFLRDYTNENIDNCLAAHEYGSHDRLIHDWKLFLRRQKGNIGDLYLQQMKDI